MKTTFALLSSRQAVVLFCDSLADTLMSSLLLLESDDNDVTDNVDNTDGVDEEPPELSSLFLFDLNLQRLEY